MPESYSFKISSNIQFISSLSFINKFFFSVLVAFTFQTLVVTSLYATLYEGLPSAYS